jgi:hypothetical protein
MDIMLLDLLLTEQFVLMGQALVMGAAPVATLEVILIQELLQTLIIHVSWGLVSPVS